MKLQKLFLTGLLTLLCVTGALAQTYYAAGVYSVFIEDRQCHLTAASEDFIITKCALDSTKLDDERIHYVFVLSGMSTDSLFICGVGMWPDDDDYTISIMDLRTRELSSANGSQGTIGYNVGRALFQAWDDLHK